jgi:O-antigen/teichoic acid export membrane protein
VTAVREQAGTAEVRRSARSGLVSLIGAGVNGAAGFVLTTVIVRSFGPAGSGAIFTAIGLVSIAAVVCCLGADTGLVWALPRRREGASRLLTVALLPTSLCALAVAAAGYAAAGPIARVLLHDPGGSARALVRLACVGIPVAVVLAVLMAGVRATRSIAPYVAVQYFLVPISRPVLIGGGVIAGAGVVTGFGLWLAPYAVGMVAACVLVAKPLGLGRGAELRPRREDWRGFWSFALPRAASAAIDASSMWTGVLLTSALVGQAEAGIFAAVGRYALAGLLVMNGLRVAVAPQISRLLGADRKEDAAVVYRQVTLWTVLLSWPGYLVLGVFGPGFLHVFGDEFRAGAAAMAVVAGAMLINVGVGIVQTVLLMSGNSRGHLFATAVGLAVNVALCLVLIPRAGALGAAVAWAAGIVIENVIAAVIAQRTLGRRLITYAQARTVAVVTAGTGVASCIGLVVAGRGLAGLATTLGVLALTCAALLASGRVRRAIGEVFDVLRPAGGAGKVQR